LSRDLLRISADRSITWRRTEFWRGTGPDNHISTHDFMSQAAGGAGANDADNIGQAFN